jgi:hypothetical protein
MRRGRRLPELKLSEEQRRRCRVGCGEGQLLRLCRCERGLYCAPPRD